MAERIAASSLASYKGVDLIPEASTFITNYLSKFPALNNVRLRVIFQHMKLLMGAL
jgi:hypothetical protein